MAVTIRKATPDEKTTYTGVYPLSHIAVADGHTLNVEYLGHDWDKWDPQYEIVCPEGFVIDVEDTHSLLCKDYADVRDRLKSLRVVPCTMDGCCQKVTA